MGAQNSLPARCVSQRERIAISPPDSHLRVKIENGDRAIPLPQVAYESLLRNETDFGDTPIVTALLIRADKRT